MSGWMKVAVVLSALLLAACAGGEPVSRAGGAGPVGLAAVTEGAPAAAGLAPRYHVRDMRVEVPRDLVVSEARLFHPVADIVWRAEPRGDRHAQVQQIVAESFGFGTAGMRQGPDAIVEARVRRFRTVTGTTRLTPGGVHSIRFDLTVKDAKTGAILEGPRLVVADVKAQGGGRAMAEGQAGGMQRAVIVEALSEVIRRELSRQVAPGGAPVAEGAPPAAAAPTAAAGQKPASFAARDRGWLVAMAGSI